MGGGGRAKIKKSSWNFQSKNRAGNVLVGEKLKKKNSADGGDKE